MPIALNGVFNRSKVLFFGRPFSSQLFCRKYSSTVDQVEVDDSAKPTLPAFAQTRLEHWHRLKQKYEQQIGSMSSQPIKVRLSNGTTKDASAWKSTPHEILTEINDKSANDAIVARVNGVLWDLKRPLETDSSLEFIQFDDADGRKVFWHSSAHVLGSALELLYGGLLSNGPPIESGFYYDIFTNGVSVMMNIMNFWWVEMGIILCFFF